MDGEGDARGRRSAVVLGTVCLAGLVLPLSFAGAAVATPAIGVDLAARATYLDWIVNAIMLAFGSLLLVAGGLADRIGRRRVFATGTAVFAAATMAIVFAPHVVWINLLRAAQGVGAAAALAGGTAALAQEYRGHARNRAFSPVAARSLAEGESWVESRLGCTRAGGGRHPLMGTHNRLLGLGLGEGVCLEVIAVDPAAAQLRWFSLDAPAMRERLDRGPALIHWVAGTDDVVALAGTAPVGLGEIIAVSRGDLRWRITVPRDGGLPAGGVFPSLIQWECERPAVALPDSGCRLESLEMAHPKARWFDQALRSMGLPADAPIRAVSTCPAPKGDWPRTSRRRVVS